jgi:hypothetical protein
MFLYECPVYIQNQCAGPWRYRLCSDSSVQFIFKTSVPVLGGIDYVLIRVYSLYSKPVRRALAVK